MTYRPKFLKNPERYCCVCYRRSDKHDKLLPQKGIFPAQLKRTDTSPIFKKHNRLDKENYGPVIVFFHTCQNFIKELYSIKLTTL